MSATYVFDAAWHAERTRLQSLERLWDEASRQALLDAGVRDGWHCLEVGAGAGSMATWLHSEVGLAGRVVATDRDTRFLGGRVPAGVEVVTHDVMHDPLPEQQFDLVHARLVVEHLGVGAVSRLRDCVRPGGSLVVEDYDFACAVSSDDDGLFERVTAAVLRHMVASGFHPSLGRRLPALLSTAGLSQVRARATTRVVRGGTPESDFYRLSLLALAERLQAEDGVVRDVRELLRRLDDPGWWGLLPVLVSAIGVR
jgi:hypothetical protein